VPVYRYPNATGDKAAKIWGLLDKLIKDPSLPPAIQESIEDKAMEILSACHCAYAEVIINSSEIKSLAPMDPTVISEIKDLLNTCR